MLAFIEQRRQGQFNSLNAMKRVINFAGHSAADSFPLSKSLSELGICVLWEDFHIKHDSGTINSEQ